MSKATKPAAENAAAKRKLTRAEKREIEAIIRKYKGDGEMLKLYKLRTNDHPQV